MSIRLMSRVFDLQLESVATKMVLLVLADNANDQGFCWPSIPTIARKSGLSERSVHRHLRELEALTMVESKARSGHSTRYQLVLRNPDPDLSPLTTCHPTPDNVSPPPLTGCHPEPSVEPSKNQRERAKPFSPPSLEEVRLLMAKSGLPENEAQKFFDHHAARGWMLGSVKMKSVSHAVGTWASRYREWKGTANGRPRTLQPPPRLDCGPEPELGL